MKNHTNEWVRTRIIKRKGIRIDGNREMLRGKLGGNKKRIEKNERKEGNIFQIAILCRGTTYPRHGTEP